MAEFWSKHKDVLDYIRSHAVDAATAMTEFAAWYAELSNKYDIVAWVAKPSSYDMMWVTCLYEEFGPKDKPAIPFSIRCIGTLAWALNKAGFMPYDAVDKTLQHTHNAVDDAMGQAFTFLKLKHSLK
jgi:hypothetical protein